MSIIDELDEIEEFLNGFFGVDLDVKNSYRPKCKPPFPTTKEEIVISIPAVNKENINVSLKDDILTVDIGYPKDDLLNRNMSTEKRQYIVKNRDKDKVTAKYIAGVLIINLPFAKEKEGINIKIN